MLLVEPVTRAVFPENLCVMSATVESVNWTYKSSISRSGMGLTLFLEASMEILFDHLRG